MVDWIVLQELSVLQPDWVATIQTARELSSQSPGMCTTKTVQQIIGTEHWQVSPGRGESGLYSKVTT